VVCPSHAPCRHLHYVRRMEESTFWQVYFTLCRRYLPVVQDVPTSSNVVRSCSPRAAVAVAAAGTLGALCLAESPADNSARPPEAHDGADVSCQEGEGHTRGGTSAVEDGENVVDTDDAVLEELEDDPELDTYLQVLGL
jgi:hypothetical protein